MGSRWVAVVTKFAARLYRHVMLAGQSARLRTQDMAVIRNSWVEKVKKKKVAETAPSYESYTQKNDFEHQTRKPKERHTPSLKATMSRTLRGVRKQCNVGLVAMVNLAWLIPTKTREPIKFIEDASASSAVFDSPRKSIYATHIPVPHTKPHRLKGFQRNDIKRIGNR